MANDYTLFWLYNEADCCDLSTFAVRLLNTIANSVPSERVWSNMNYIHSKARNRLSLDTVDKLLFIYNNSRVLKQLGMDNLIDTEQLAWGE
jgi:hAT family C-terminal dimerisation region